MEEEGLGGKFWLLLILGAITCAFVGLLFFIFLGNAWARWGFFGMFLVLAWSFSSSVGSSTSERRAPMTR